MVPEVILNRQPDTEYEGTRVPGKYLAQSVHLVPTLNVGMPAWPLCVALRLTSE